MDNSTTTWIMVALLLLLIGAAIFMLLRRPGGDGTAVDNRHDEAVGSRDVVAEGRDLGPGTTAPDLDAHRDEPLQDSHAADDQPFDQQAVADGATGTDGRAYAAETGEAYRGADHDAGHDAGHGAHAAAVDERGADEHPVDDGYRADDEQAHDEQAHVERADDEPSATGDQDRMRDAAAVGAMGAAGAGAAGATRQEHESGTHVEDTHDIDAGADVHQDTHDTAADADVHPLSSEEIDAGARQEPLTTDRQAAPQEHDDRSDDTVGAPGDDRDGYDAATSTTQLEDRPVDEAGDDYRADDEVTTDRVDDDVTTYRADDGDAVVVEDMVGEPGMQEEHGYHDDTTPVRGDDGPSYTDTVPPADPTDAAGERVADDPGTQHGTEGGLAPAVGAGAAGAGAAAWSDSTSTDPGTAEPYGDTAYAEPDPGTAEPHGDTAYAGTDDIPGDATSDTEAGGAVFAESVYGPGSADPLEDGSGPEGWAVKGNSGSMLFHTPDSPSYDAVRAEVWFESEDAARAAGFAHWDRRRR